MSNPDNTQTKTADVTVVVVPRERFSFTRQNLESIYEHTSHPFKLLYIDGGSPRPVQNYLQDQSQSRGFKVIRTEHYLTPNQARNLAWREVKTKYIVFVDNDVLVTPGWLKPLVEAAEQTGAWVIGPTVCFGDIKIGKIHVAGGDVFFKESPDSKKFIEQHRQTGKRLPDIRDELKPGPTGLIEFHCMMVRTDVIDHLGPLDEGLMSALEHCDLCLQVKQAGGLIYYEPASIVTYVIPPPFKFSDMPYYLLRWSEAWNIASMKRFKDKWKMVNDTEFDEHQWEWLYRHRRIGTRHMLRPVKWIYNVMPPTCQHYMQRLAEAPLITWASRGTMQASNN